MSAPQTVCPVCNAQPGEPCTVPTNNSRRPVAWTHYIRPGVPQ